MNNYIKINTLLPVSLMIKSQQLKIYIYISENIGNFYLLFKLVTEMPNDLHIHSHVHILIVEFTKGKADTWSFCLDTTVKLHMALRPILFKGIWVELI